MKLPIQYHPCILTPTSTGGTLESFGSPISDFAEVKEVSYSKDNKAGQDEVKRFKVDYRPSLAINRSWLIEFEGVKYTILTIQKEGLKQFHYLIEAKAKR